jgi:uncharacterized membrane protein
MKAVCWNGKKDVRVQTVPDPEIINPRDAIIKTERSLPGSSIDHTGSVFFHSVPRRNGTEVKVMLAYKPPAGSAGAAVWPR